METLFIVFIGIVVVAVVVVPMILCMQPERGTAPKHWWQQ